MIQKPLASITWEDIENLARQGIPESTSLEFKAEPIRDNLEVARDVSALGNGGGGDIILGIPEVNGVAQPPVPFAGGEGEGNRVVQIVAAGVSPFPRGITTRVLSAAGGDVVVIRIPRSRIPLMVHLYGPRTEFWVRRDRQRVMMTHAEILSTIRAGLEEMQQRGEFIRERVDQFLKHVPGLSLYLSVSPATPPLGRVVPVRDGAIHAIMRDHSRDHDTFVWGVDPRPSLHGLAGSVGTDYFFEIHHDGHVEIRFFNPPGLIREFQAGQIPLNTVALIGHFLARSVVEIVRRARRVFDLSGFFDEYVVTLVLGNSQRTVLIRPHHVLSGPRG